MAAPTSMMMRLILPLCMLIAGCHAAPVQSPSEVQPTVSGPKTILVPKALRMVDRCAVFKPADAERIVVDTPAGMYFGTRVTEWGNGKERSESLRGLPDPNDPNPIAQWNMPGNPPPPYPVTLVVEVFETSQRPVHMWSPESSNAYKVVWKKSFTVAPNG
jgi:hypothetical protein